MPSDFVPNQLDAMKYYIWNADGKCVFDLDGRVQEIFSGQNMNGHYNNGSVHRGGGDSNENLLGTWAPPHLLKSGEAVYSLPPQPRGYYLEYVWNGQGLPADLKRMIIGQNGEVYVTNDHYHVYYKVHEVEGSTHMVFNDKGSKHTFFDN